MIHLRPSRTVPLPGSSFDEANLWEAALVVTDAAEIVALLDAGWEPVCIARNGPNQREMLFRRRISAGELRDHYAQEVPS